MIGRTLAAALLLLGSTLAAARGQTLDAPRAGERDRLPLFEPAPPPSTAQGNARAPSPLIGTPLEPVVRVGRALLDAGILPRVRYVQSFAANPVGGLTQGTDTSGVVIFGADFDMGKLVGLQGGQIHATFAQFFGHELATDHIGTRTKVQSFYYPRKQFELAELTYEQSLFDKRMTVIVGRANATGQFARSTYGCRFQNVADCPFELTQAVGGFPGFPYVNWGGSVRINPTPATYFKTGAFETNSTRNTNSGFDWGLNHSTGYVIPFEIGYGTEYATDPYPAHAKIGGWYNSAPYNDPYLNTSGRSRALFNGRPLVWSGGRAGIYALADKVVWRAGGDEKRGPPRGIALFATAGAPFDGKGLFAFEAVAGALWAGPFASRPFDQIGLLGSYIRLSNKQDGYLNDLLRRAGSTTFVSRNQFIFEANYNARLLEGIYLAGGLQYLVNPDSISRPSATFAPKDALVVGLKLSVSINSLAGLPLALGEE